MVVAAAVSYPLARDAATQEALSSLDQVSNATAIAIEQRPAGSTDVLPTRLTAQLRSQDVSVYYVSAGAGVPSFLTTAEGAALSRGESVSGVRRTDGGDVLFSARPLASGAVVVLVEPETVSFNVAIKTITRFFIALAIGVAIAILFGLLLARRLTRPLRRVADAANRLGEGDRDVVLPAEGPREIADLALAMNGLSSALAQSEGRQRDFLLSVSHELRTPLTTIRGYSEALADGIVPPELVAKTGVTLQSESNRLDRLVSDLLELARLDAQDFPISAAPVDFRALGQEACAVWSDRCLAEELVFSSETPVQELSGVTDATRVRQIIDNLCANALRVTPAEQMIVLAIRPEGENMIVIEVRDSGPGLTEDDCRVAFEPAELYSRYRGIRTVGSGVGLALVGRLARRLGGSAHAGTAAEGGARFTILISRDLG